MEPAKKKHSLMLDSRSNLVITGAEDVNGFNEETVSVRTTDGTLIIKGSGPNSRRRFSGRLLWARRLPCCTEYSSLFAFPSRPERRRYFCSTFCLCFPPLFHAFCFRSASFRAT